MHNSFSILTVCTGNVCRSPLAQQLLASQLQDVPEIEVSSAGLQALVGQPMFDVTREMARSYGIEDTASHRARQATEGLLESSDLILTMTREQRRAVVELSPRVTRRAFTIREFARLAEATTDDVLVSEMSMTSGEPVDRLRAAVKAVTVRRGTVPPVVDPSEDEVVDPYQREMEVHEESARQLVPAVDEVIALLRRSMKGAV